MRILYIGCVKSSELLLQKLIDLGANISGVITKKASNANADFSDLAGLCKKNKIKYIYVNNINDNNSVEFIDQVKPDIGFCFGWSQIIKNEILKKFPRGVLGFHPAALPQNKGRHPIIWALVLGLKETASTFFLMDETADGGSIVSQKEIIINYEDDAADLYKKIMEVAEEQIEDIYVRLEQGVLFENMIPNQGGNSWRKRRKDDGKIDWRMSGKSIYDLVRGLTKPYVGAHFVYQEKEYKVWKVREIETQSDSNIEPGKILKVYGNGQFDVKVADEVIRVLKCDVINIKEGEYL